MERVFTKAVQDRLEVRLRELPAVHRQYWKGRFWPALKAAVEEGATPDGTDVDRLLESCRGHQGATRASEQAA